MYVDKSAMDIALIAAETSCSSSSSSLSPLLPSSWPWIETSKISDPAGMAADPDGVETSGVTSREIDGFALGSACLKAMGGDAFACGCGTSGLGERKIVGATREDEDCASPTLIEVGSSAGASSPCAVSSGSHEVLSLDFATLGFLRIAADTLSAGWDADGTEDTDEAAEIFSLFGPLDLVSFLLRMAYIAAVKGSSSESSGGGTSAPRSLPLAAFVPFVAAVDHCSMPFVTTQNSVAITDLLCHP